MNGNHIFSHVEKIEKEREKIRDSITVRMDCVPFGKYRRESRYINAISNGSTISVFLAVIYRGNVSKIVDVEICVVATRVTIKLAFIYTKYIPLIVQVVPLNI